MVLKGSYALLLGAFAAVNAVKDDEYYRAGMGNPNVDLTMYWADAHNVLEDLDQFSYLYIQYHNCAWAQNRNQYSEDDEGSGSQDENDYWYIGATPNYAANVAYSLYGSLAGQQFSGCNEDTFINSFTTNRGFEAFAKAIYYAGSSSTDYSQSYSSECQGGAGVVCDYQVGFGYASFSTDTCDPYYATGISDSMGYMNSAFQSAQCVQIYDASTDYYSNNDDNNNRDLKEEQKFDKKENENEDRNLQNNYGYGNNYNNYNYGNSEYGYGYNSYASNYYNYANTALAILYYSNACFVQNYWAIDGGCPDPYGKLQEYQQNFNKGVRKSMKVDTYVNYRANMKKGKKYVMTGVLLFMTSLIFFLSEQLMAFKARKKAGLTKRKKSSGKKKSVVELVHKTGGRIKKSATKGVKKAVARVKGKTECSGVSEADGIIVNAENEA
eukprot:CAMPEP_0201124164 /NCGR_PEP_ID=MMETSP0850-20130426/10591_1 /ASSEMBLY_ACC=CAM_ASM_000622 /TAXON_ID=183588 /ORGANISM="Pseudo-nitzschia fraudulenta, Strain WWA7" /LENGTH=438 /DNA_ID=CAMNT_0047391361 /DNA_START=111 /DNA_END=1427 /DNA_ORIENTATION=-